MKQDKITKNYSVWLFEEKRWFDGISDKEADYIINNVEKFRNKPLDKISFINKAELYKILEEANNPIHNDEVKIDFNNDELWAKISKNFYDIILSDKDWEQKFGGKTKAEIREIEFKEKTLYDTVNMSEIF